MSGVSNAQSFVIIDIDTFLGKKVVTKLSKEILSKLVISLKI